LTIFVQSNQNENKAEQALHVVAESYANKRRQFYLHRFVLEHIVIEYFIFSFKNYFLFQIRISYSCSLQETIKNWIFVEKTSLGRISRRRGGTCAVYVPEPCQNK
jgi:hypothetical protein